MAKKKNRKRNQPADAKPAAAPPEAVASDDPIPDQLKRARRALTLRGRTAAEVVMLNEEELENFAALVTENLQPSTRDFGIAFDILWQQHRQRLLTPANESE